MSVLQFWVFNRVFRSSLISGARTVSSACILAVPVWGCWPSSCESCNHPRIWYWWKLGSHYGFCFLPFHPVTGQVSPRGCTGNPTILAVSCHPVMGTYSSESCRISDPNSYTFHVSLPSKSLSFSSFSFLHPRCLCFSEKWHSAFPSVSPVSTDSRGSSLVAFLLMQPSRPFLCCWVAGWECISHLVMVKAITCLKMPHSNIS